MLRSRLAGFIVVLISTVLWSTAGLFVQMADLDTWSVVAWRSLFSILALGVFWVVATGNRAATLQATLRGPGMLAILIGIVGGISYIVALQMTSVANVMTVYAALPFIASAIAFFALGERVTTRFVVCGLIASFGILIMSGSALSFNDIVGIVTALVMTVSFAAALVQAKRYPHLDMTLVTVLSTVATGIIALPLMKNSAPEPYQLLACALLGTLTTGVANVLSLVGGRLIRSGEAAFLLLLDVVLGPLWVWLAFDEQVGMPALIGGSIVMGAVTWYLVRPGETAKTA
ncbi:DMT family transporter [Mesorhizobium sp. RP14(2022)]|uniref:DMT family transporter n=1 Tax=Mesorhizobium liriopis TaxID=2953882 RepID=A0ABT1C6N9_9HYPH|nr:DMT family transporter [Mesorhizobium liriopis]MCO6050486.1 DMT family transporter [Mesorhizobium liriopis]